MTGGLENPGVEDEQVGAKFWAPVDLVSVE